MESIKFKSAAFVEWAEKRLEEMRLDKVALEKLSESLSLDGDDKKLIELMSSYVLLKWAERSKHDVVVFEELILGNRAGAVAAIQVIIELLQSIGRCEKRPPKWESLIN